MAEYPNQTVGLSITPGIRPGVPQIGVTPLQEIMPLAERLERNVVNELKRANEIIDALTGLPGIPEDAQGAPIMSLSLSMDISEALVSRLVLRLEELKIRIGSL